MRSADIAAYCRELAVRVKINGEWGELHETLESAAAEIERLKLTSAERETIEYCVRQADEYDRVGFEDAEEAAATLRTLLERTK